MNRKMLIAATLVSSVVAVAALAPIARAQTPLGTAFTYQGVLKTGSAPVNGAADLRFMLFDAASAGNQVGATMEYPAWPVVDGQFTLSLDFGALAFNGDERWLQIEVRAPAGSGSYVALTPRQRLTATPYALRALNASISGVQPVALTFSNATNTYSGSSMNIDAGTLQVDAANHVVGIGGTSTLARLNVATANRPVGVWVENTSNTGSVDTGVYGSALDYGGFFQSTSNGPDAIGLYGLASNTSGLNYGVLGRSLSPNGYAGYFDGARTYVSQRLGVGTDAPTHQLTVYAPDAETMRLFGSQGSFGHGARLNFGDGDYAFLEEDFDDALHLHADRLMVSSPNVGNDTLVLPSESVASSETFDEPGVASDLRQGSVEGSIALSFAGTSIQSVAVNAPGPGYVIAMAWAECSNLSSGTTIAAHFAIGTNPFTFPSDKVYIQHVDTPNERFLVNIHRVLPVASAGWVNVHFLGALGAPTTPLTVINSRLTLLFVPTAYGPVDLGSTPSSLAREAPGVPPSSIEPARNPDIEALRSEVAELKRQVQALLGKKGNEQ